MCKHNTRVDGDDQLPPDVEVISSELEALQHAHRALQQTNQQLEIENQTLLQEIGGQRDNGGQETAMFESFQAEIERLNAHCQELEAEVEHSRAGGGGGGSGGNVARVEEENQLLRQQCLEFGQEVERLRHEVSVGSNPGAPSSFELEELRAENNELVARTTYIAEVEEQLKRLEAEVNMLRAENALLVQGASNAGNQSSRPASPRGIQLSEEEAHRLESLMDKLQSEAAQLRADYAALEEQTASRPNSIQEPLHLGSRANLGASAVSSGISNGFPRPHLSAEAQRIHTVAPLRTEPVAAAAPSAAFVFADMGRSRALPVQAGIAAAPPARAAAFGPSASSHLTPGVTTARVLSGGLAGMQGNAGRPLQSSVVRQAAAIR